MVYVSLAIASAIPIIYLVIVRRYDLYKTGKYQFNLVTLLWGVIAYLVAARINPALVNAGWVSRDFEIRVIAPILEEFLKSLILIYLVQRADFNYVVDGAIYGFGAGIGFAIVENHEYVMGHIAIALAVAVARVFSTNLVHATGSGMIGTALAARRADPSWKSWVLILIGYAFSMSFHMVFNTMVSSGAFLVFAVVYGFIGAGLIWYTIRRGMHVQKEWVGEKLGAQDRVTKSEATMVVRIEDLHESLTPIAAQFGAEKVPLVEAMIRKQAEIGIKRKLMDTTPNENKRREIEAIVDSLAAEMDVLRRQIGPYCMMFVRMVYLEQEGKVWDAIGSRIDESSTGQKGGGLWDRTTDRIQTSKSEEGQP